MKKTDIVRLRHMLEAAREIRVYMVVVYLFL